MKLVVLLLACATSAFAESNFIDFSNAKPIQEYSWFWEDKPGFINPTGDFAMKRRARIVNGQEAT